MKGKVVYFGLEDVNYKIQDTTNLLKSEIHCLE
jgi:hypothetical protein